MIQLRHSVRVNDRSDPEAPVLTRDDVWDGLVMKAENALPFVPRMEKCEGVEHPENFILRDIRFGRDDLREAVTLTPKTAAEFLRVEARLLEGIPTQTL